MDNEKEARALIIEMTATRQEKRLSLRKLAKQLQAEYATIWRWEKGKSIPNSFHMYHIRKWLGYLYVGEDTAF